MHTRLRIGLIPMLMGLLSSLFYLSVSYPIFESGPDAIDQLAGAYSLVMGQGYAMETGEPVRYWPPLYALTTALFIKISPTFTMVALSNALLLGGVAISWSLFILWASSTL
ncbi:MAG: hypothetical protein RI907_555, partial [Pseudomonadota bacterium]